MEKKKGIENMSEIDEVVKGIDENKIKSIEFKSSWWSNYLKIEFK